MAEDNPVTQTDNDQTQTAVVDAPASNAGSFSWKSHLAPDYANAPTVQKFADTKEGFNDVIKSHLSLEQMLGHEKVPIPKGPDDTEGWNRFSKAMGVPDKADAYGLTDPEVPQELKDKLFNKQEFSEIMHSFKLTPNQAKGLWGAFTDKMKDAYQKSVKAHEENMKQVANQLRGEWGDAYDSNVELGQLVINKFSSDKDMQDFVTASILQNPMGAKFLSQIGSQFAENKIGEFGYKRFSLTPEQAQSEIDSIIRDEKHPYNNDKVSENERQRAIDYVNGLYAVVAKSRG